MGSIYLPESASNARKRDAARARQNRAEIIRELSWGRVSRRDLIKWGLFTSAGLLAPVGGLNPLSVRRPPAAAASRAAHSPAPRRSSSRCRASTSCRATASPT